MISSTDSSAEGYSVPQLTNTCLNTIFGETNLDTSNGTRKEREQKEREHTTMHIMHDFIVDEEEEIRQNETLLKNLMYVNIYLP